MAFGPGVDPYKIIAAMQQAARGFGPPPHPALDAARYVNDEYRYEFAPDPEGIESTWVIPGRHPLAQGWKRGGEMSPGAAQMYEQRSDRNNRIQEQMGNPWPYRR